MTEDSKDPPVLPEDSKDPPMLPEDSKDPPVLPPTQYVRHLEPPVLDNKDEVLEQHKDEVLEQRRKEANYKRHVAAQLPDEVRAEIAEYRRHHSDASNNAIARWLQAHPKTKLLVAHLKLRSLANKIPPLQN